MGSCVIGQVRHRSDLGTEVDGPAEVSEWSHIISTELACIEHSGPLNDSKVSRAEEGRSGKSVAGRRCRRAQSSGCSQYSRSQRVRDLTSQNWEDTEGLMGCGRGQEAYYEDILAYQSVIAPTKPG
jgi:hypothetical protein